MLELNDDTFAENIYTTKKPLLIMFSAKWCNVCKEFVPKVDELKKIYEDKVVFAEVDIDESFRLCSGLQIDKLPTFIIYYKKEPITYIVGAANISKFKEEINKLLN